jgi:hypothetical protein
MNAPRAGTIENAIASFGDTKNLCKAREVVRQSNIRCLECNIGSPAHLLINQLEFAATTVAAICLERWQIELFFKALSDEP